MKVEVTPYSTWNADGIKRLSAEQGITTAGTNKGQNRKMTEIRQTTGTLVLFPPSNFNDNIQSTVPLLGIYNICTARNPQNPRNSKNGQESMVETK